MPWYKKSPKYLYMALVFILVASLVTSGTPMAMAQQAEPSATGDPGVGRGFTATIGDATFGPGRENDKISLKADEIAGKMMQLKGDFVSLDVDLDTLAISDFTVEGTTVYAMVSPQLAPVLTDDLTLTFDRERVVVERGGANGMLTFRAEDSNDGGILGWRPGPTGPPAMNVEYTLAPGLRYAGVLTGIDGEQQLHFTGLKNGFEASVLAPQAPELARLVSFTAMSSMWNVPRLSRLETELDGPFGRGAFVASIDGVIYKAKKVNDRTTIKLKAAKVAGKTMRIIGQYNTMSISLDTFAVTNFTLDGVVLFSSVAPQHNTVLTGDLTMEFDREKLRLQRNSPAGLMKFRADDMNFLKIMEWSPNPTPPNTMDIVFTLGTGIVHSTPEMLPGVKTRLPFSGMGKTGAEESSVLPNDPQLATLKSWTPATSVWTVTAQSSVNIILPVP